MISSEVQRTLVKSPPELWAELSDPDALARHLSDLGEIRITRVEPEERVEWESPGTTGTVLIKASGWGTRVTLSVQREMAAPDQPAAADTEDESAPPEPAAEAGPADVAVALPDTAEADTEDQQAAPAGSDELPSPDAPSADELDPAPAAFEHEPAPAPVRRGFIARFLYFFRGSDAPAEPSAPAIEAPVDEPAAGRAEEPVSASAPAEVSTEAPPPAQAHEPGPETAAPSSEPQEEPASPGAPEDRQTPSENADQPEADVSAELLAAEESATEQVTAVLTAALDRLGAAHHRPFSRA